MLVNAHDHLSFYKDIDKAIEIIEKEKVFTLATSMNEEDFKSLLPWKNHPYIKIGWGIHPWEVLENTDLSEVDSLIEKADFIGEVGLDYHWDKRKDIYAKQAEVFKYFIYLSKKHGKFANIHTKGAEKEVLQILNKYQPPSPIIHWYSGDLSLVDDYLNVSSYFTISVDAGYSQLTDHLIDMLPLDRILTETDGPTSLEWINGEKSKPSYVADILTYIAQVKNLDREQVKKQVYLNYNNLWNKK